MSAEVVQDLLDRMASEPEFAARVHDASDAVLGDLDLSAEEAEVVLAEAERIVDGDDVEVSGFGVSGDPYDNSRDVPPPAVDYGPSNSRAPWDQPKPAPPIRDPLGGIRLPQRPY